VKWNGKHLSQVNSVHYHHLLARALFYVDRSNGLVDCPPYSRAKPLYINPKANQGVLLARQEITTNWNFPTLYSLEKEGQVSISSFDEGGQLQMRVNGALDPHHPIGPMKTSDDGPKSRI
jgi:hypothetical protein